MKGDTQLIDHLNSILGNELMAINQYFLHARMYKNWGLTKLGQKTHTDSIDEMKHADSLVDRILFLEGLPNLQDLGKFFVGETVPEMLECDRKLEQAAIPALKDAITCAEQNKDFVTRDLLHSILASEEEHLDWLEQQLHLIEQVGLQNYLQQQL